MRAFLSILVASLLVSGCVSPSSEIVRQPPAAIAFVEHHGVQLPLYDLSGVRPKHLVRPKYPPEEKANKIAGEAVIRVLVAADGTIAQLQIRKSFPSAAIGEAAREAVSQWRFPKIMSDGTASDYFVDVPVVFAPEGTPIA